MDNQPNAEYWMSLSDRLIISQVLYAGRKGTKMWKGLSAQFLFPDCLAQSGLQRLTF